MGDRAHGVLTLPLHPAGTVTPIDGNGAAAHVAYAFSDSAFIYPSEQRAPSVLRGASPAVRRRSQHADAVSPATPMGEYIDTWCGPDALAPHRVFMCADACQGRGGAEEPLRRRAGSGPGNITRPGP